MVRTLAQAQTQSPPQRLLRQSPCGDGERASAPPPFCYNTLAMTSSEQREVMRKRLGQIGSWSIFGFPSLSEIEPDEPCPPVPEDVAKARIKSGTESVRSPLGETLLVNEQTLRHLGKNGRTRSEFIALLRDGFCTCDKNVGASPEGFAPIAGWDRSPCYGHARVSASHPYATLKGRKHLPWRSLQNY